MSKRNETVGLPIGPATSSVSVEIILSAIDKILREKYKFVRYVDDYSVVCKTHDEAQRFLRDLEVELSKYKLMLNLAKTHINKLPEPSQEKWVCTLLGALPRVDLADANGVTKKDALEFLSLAIHLNNETPDGSVLKFSIAILLPLVRNLSSEVVFDWVLNKSWYFPILLPYLEKISNDKLLADEYREEVAKRLKSIVVENAINRRSDGMCWALYYLILLNQNIDDDIINEVLKSKDCTAISLLTKFDDAINKVAAYASEIINFNDFEKDRNWLLLYQLFIMDRINNPYAEDWFQVMKDLEVDFLADPNKTSKAENYCDLYSNPFVDQDKKPKFNDWLSGSATFHSIPLVKWGSDIS